MSQPDPRNGLTYDFATGDNTWGPTYNTNIRTIGSTLNIAAIDFENNPPGSPSDGDTYIVDSVPTGIWVGQSDDIAIWFNTDAVWRFFTPIAGTKVFITSGTRINELVCFNGTSWSTNGFLYTF